MRYFARLPLPNPPVGGADKHDNNQIPYHQKNFTSLPVKLFRSSSINPNL
jgi:hypothetical protein